MISLSTVIHWRSWKRPFSKRPFAAVAIAILMGTFSAQLLAADNSTEYRIKAAFLFNFARFVEWPDTKFVSATSPLQICIYGSDPFGEILDETVRGKSVGDHPLVVLRIAKIDELKSCEIVYMADTESARFATVIAALKGSNSLLVNDHPDFINQGGMIRFLIVDRKLRFEINPDAAKREQLKISSKLLQVAKIVADES